jgi:hypothetical protein
MKAHRQPPKPAGYHWDAAEPIVRPDGKPPCRWCKGPVEPPRRVFCSRTCALLWDRRLRGMAACRALCRRRDRGVCGSCGLDTAQLRREYRACRLGAITLGNDLAVGPVPDVTKLGRALLGSRLAIEVVYGVGKSAIFTRCGPRVAKALKAGRSHWEADHVVELADGGDYFDASNLATLCKDCHHRKTAAAARARRAVKVAGGCQ